MCKVLKDVSELVWKTAYRGAKKGSMRDFEKFMQISEPHIKSIARSYARNSVEMEDFCQSAREYLVHVINNKKDPISLVKNYMLKTIKCTVKHEKDVLNKRGLLYDSLDAPIKCKDGLESAKSTLCDTIRDAKASDANLHCYFKEVMKKLKTLPKNMQRILLAQIDGSNKNSAELAKELNISAAYVDKLRERARKQLADMCDYYNKKPIFMRLTA